MLRVRGIIYQIEVQGGPGDTAMYMRRGCDFTLQNVIKWFHADEDFVLRLKLYIL